MNKKATSINKIFWGLIIVLVDINIVYFDILPDFIGYIIIASGLSHLQTYSPYFSKAKIFSIILTVFSLVTIFQGPSIPLEEFQPSKKIFLIIVFSTILGLLHLALIYFIVRGLIEMAEQEGFIRLSEMAQKRLYIYIIGTLVPMAAYPFVLNVDDSEAFFIFVISIVITVIIEITILVLIRVFKNRFQVIDQ
ncbi:hypothetical protein F7731_25295 [Cytobacillus depressus]|uniref:Uncharacterized protein n=1 Tax=Cytobacillus depressus TaxID=1602942 RepID=A0A6L3UX81_9BACI|nr:hypothetical protein [Cytobacillus depressus]KAB2328541.1 hypothetical protein F7731_25295 [Cytobacillus depressus]